MEELTAADKFRNQGTLWAANFLSADETIPVTTIIVAKGGTELTDAFKQKCSVTSQQQIRLPDGRMMQPLATRFQLTDGAEGFSYFVGFGTGERLLPLPLPLRMESTILLSASALAQKGPQLRKANHPLPDLTRPAPRALSPALLNQL